MSDNPLNDQISQDGQSILKDLINDVAELKVREFFNSSCARVFNTSSINIASGGSPKIISFTTVDYDTHDYFDIGTPNRLTIPFDMIGSVKANAAFEIDANGIVQFGIRLNGSVFLGFDQIAVLSGENYYLDLCCDYLFSEGDYIQMTVYQNTGTDALVLSENYHSPVLSINKVR